MSLVKRGFDPQLENCSRKGLISSINSAKSDTHLLLRCLLGNDTKSQEEGASKSRFCAYKMGISPLLLHSFHEDGLKIGGVKNHRYVAGPGFRDGNVRETSMEAHDVNEGQSSPLAGAVLSECACSIGKALASCPALS